MVDSYDLTKVSEHRLFCSLGDKVPLGSAKCVSLLACNGDVVYVWNSCAGCLEAVSKKSAARHGDLTSVRRFYPSRRPLFNVERLLLNPSGTLVALWGPAGVSVMQLPSRWTDDGLHSREMPSLNLGQSQRCHLKVRQVRWHPGSPLDSHLVVLTSDECLRLYDSALGPLLWSCSLSYRRNLSRGNLPCAADLGHTPVDFDFSTPLLHEDIEEIEWPLLVLWGNGEVYTVVTKLKEVTEKIPLLGPLLMFPESDDNYGIDASSIMVIDTSPPIVVLATCEGTLYNCLLLNSEDSKLPNDPGKSLHVVESIELELGISVGDIPDDAISCPIRLEKDPVEKSRYLCIHKAGVHSVTLPLVARLMEFVNNTPDEDFSYDTRSFADYFLCTAMASDCGLSYNPILGLTHLDLDRYLVLLSDSKVLDVALPTYSAHSTVNLLPGVNLDDGDDDGFRVMIQDILKKASKPPLLKLPLDAATDSKVMLEIGLGMMQRHREDIFKAYKTVAQKMKDRVRSLKQSMTNQRQDIDNLTSDKTRLQNCAESIAERYEEINEKQAELMSRTEELLKKLRCHQGALTKQEKKLNNILDNVTVRMEHVRKEMDKIQTTALVEPDDASRLSLRQQASPNYTTYMGESKKKMVKTHLESITLEIQSLTKRIKDLKTISNTIKS